VTKRPKPTVHGRDHEHGGADPTLIHWEDVGDEGGGTGSGIQFDVINTGDWIEIDTTDVNPDTDTGIQLYSTAQMQLFSDDEIVVAANEIGIRSSGAGVSIDASHSGDNLTLTVDQSNGAYLLIHGLPTSDPATTDAIWNDGGVLKISS
jgi:hypothetical protein